MRETTLTDYRERILSVLVHIQQNLDAALSIEALARRAYFSPFHFHRVFRGMVGESVMQHVRRLRLERAAMRLKHGDDPVTRIAFDAGYETHEAFTRAFRSMFGVAPSRFRDRARAVSLPPAPSGVHYAAASDTAAIEFREKEARPMQVEVRRIPPMRVAFKRHTGPYMEVGRTWETFVPWLGSQGLLGAETQFIGVGHDDPEVTPPEKVRYDACVTVDDRFEPEGEVGVTTIGDGEYAVTVHHGPYEKLGETYAALCGEWVPRSGRELRAAPCLEFYLNDPESTESEELLTEVCVALEPR
jgi:AraC family transcriptional regulator